MSCEGCNKANTEPEKIPYIVYEGAMARAERTMKRLVIALIIAVVLIFASNVAWLWYISQYDFESYEYDYSQDGQGINIIGEHNEVQQYEPKTGSQETSPQD